MIGRPPSIQLRDFVRESNRIEGIYRDPLPVEIRLHEDFLALDQVLVHDLCSFVETVAGAALRDGLGMDVRVGSHRPPPGGPGVRVALDSLLREIEGCVPTPYEAHVEYEQLHPFTDGNGRSGRALWAWMMLQEHNADPFALPFLHRFYYQALDAARS